MCVCVCVCVWIILWVFSLSCAPVFIPSRTRQINRHIKRQKTEYTTSAWIRMCRDYETFVCKYIYTTMSRGKKDEKEK